jgi:hypothetical protein
MAVTLQSLEHGTPRITERARQSLARRLSVTMNIQWDERGLKPLLEGK